MTLSPFPLHFCPFWQGWQSYILLVLPYYQLIIINLYYLSRNIVFFACGIANGVKCSWRAHRWERVDCCSCCRPVWQSHRLICWSTIEGADHRCSQRSSQQTEGFRREDHRNPVWNQRTRVSFFPLFLFTTNSFSSFLWHNFARGLRLGEYL